MAYTVMAYAVMALIFMAYTVMALIVIAYTANVKNSFLLRPAVAWGKPSPVF